MPKYSKEEVETARRFLLEELSPGSTVWTVLRYSSRSGMVRCISPIVIDKKGRPWDISWAVARILGSSCDPRRGGMRVSGCGMDMGFHLVYNLSATLFHGFDCIGKDCPSNDHSNGEPSVKRYTPETCPGRPCSVDCDHVGIPDVRHSNGGFALRHCWL